MELSDRTFTFLIVFSGYNFLMIGEKNALLDILNLLVLPRLSYKPVEKVSSFKHVNLWFTLFYEMYEHTYHISKKRDFINS